MTKSEELTDYFDRPYYKPDAEQIEQLKALNQRMQKACTAAYNQLLEVDKENCKRLKDKNDPLVDFDVVHVVIFYHKTNHAVLAKYEDYFIPGMHEREDWIAFGRDGSSNWHPMVKGLENECLSPWFARLIDFYKMNWYELFNIGQIEIEYEIQFNYKQYINDEPEA